MEGAEGSVPNSQGKLGDTGLILRAEMGLGNFLQIRKKITSQKYVRKSLGINPDCAKTVHAIAAV